jgi:hypothetical protein
MTNTPPTQSPLLTVLRPAISLIAWLDDQQAQLTLSKRQRAPLTPENQAILNAARKALSQRSTGYTPGPIEEDPAQDLLDYGRNLLSHPRMAAFAKEGWELKLISLSDICAAQSNVFTDHAVERAAGINAGDLMGLASVSLPVPTITELPAQFDPAKSAWIFTSQNPNLRIVGNFGAEVSPGVTGFGFAVEVGVSMMQVARFRGRYILRDGYHRAYGLLKAGITKVPVLVRDFQSIEQIGLPAGLLPQDAYLGDRPALLKDYFDPVVSASVELPATRKVLIVQAVEVNTLG